MRTSRRSIGLGLGVALAAALVMGALAGCSDGDPVEEVSAGSGRDASSRAGAQVGGVTPVDGATTPGPDTPIGSDGSVGSDGSSSSGRTGGGTEPGQPGQIEPSPPVRGIDPPPPVGDTPEPTPPRDPNDPRHPHPWDGYTVGADGRTLTFTYYAGVAPCSVFDSIVADETADVVRVTIYEHSGPDGVACIMLAQQKSASVTLDAPLGGRQLVDGALG